MSWQLVEHTADVAIEVHADSAGDALAQAATALASIITEKPDPRIIPAEHELTATVQAPDMPALAVAWLSEVLWLLESKDQLWISGGVQLGGADAGGLQATGSGNAATYRHGHGRGTEVKAVTYHGLVFQQRGKDWFLRVLLDI